MPKNCPHVGILAHTNTHILTFSSMVCVQNNTISCEEGQLQVTLCPLSQFVFCLNTRTIITSFDGAWEMKFLTMDRDMTLLL